ncbi:MAG: tetratricopeptide repeat protein, partial [Microcystis panniformis]
SEAYILILDNLESVTGQPLAIENTLPENEREAIAEFLKNLVGGKTKVILGSRSEETWLQRRTFKENIYQLQGLDQESRTELAERILERQAKGRKNAIKKDDYFKRLMKLLAGYPLAMEVVLANLKRQSPEEIYRGLQLAELVNVGDEDKTNNIIKCVEYSHSNLSEEAQKLLLCLAPFSGFIHRGVIPNYSQELQQLEPLQGYQFDQFDAAIEEAIHWGLLSPMGEELSRFLTIQPIFPYFLKTKLKELAPETQAAIWEGFKNHYRGLAGYYNNLLDSKNPQEKQWGILFCRWEYENLFNALQICLEKQEDIYIFFCLHLYFFVTNDVNSSLKLCEIVCQACQSYPEEIKTGIIGSDIVGALGNLANTYTGTKNYEQAKQTYLKVIELTQNLQGVDEQQKASILGTVYHNLGRVAEELREWEQARSYYQQAIEIKIEYGDRYEQAGTLHQLGGVAEGVGELSQAKSYYLQALQIWAEFKDSYAIQTYSLPCLVDLYQQTQDEEIFVAAADILGVGVEDSNSHFETILRCFSDLEIR